MKLSSLQLVLALAAGAFSLSASTISLTLPQYTGPGAFAGFPLPPVTIGTFTYTIPVGEQIVSASFSSTFGNSAFPDTGAVNVFVGGIAVGSCASTDPCDLGSVITPFGYTFLPADFNTLNSGSLAVTAVQTGPNIVQLGAETLNILTASSNPTPPSIPEPSSVALIGIGLGGLAVSRLRKQRT